MKATEFLEKAGDTLTQRGEAYDTSGGERSAKDTVDAFNAITGHKLVESDVWLMLLLLKLVRQEASEAYHPDSALDAVGYASLMAECLSENKIPF